MKLFWLFLISAFLFIRLETDAQQQIPLARLTLELKTARGPAQTIPVLDSLWVDYEFYSTKMDSALYYSKAIIREALPLRDKRPLILGYTRLSLYYDYIADFKTCFEVTMQAIKLSGQAHIPDYLADLYSNLGFTWVNFDNYDAELQSAREGEQYLKASRDPLMNTRVYLLTQISEAHQWKKNYDSAWYYIHLAGEALTPKDQVERDFYLWFLGNYYQHTQDYHRADSVDAIGEKLSSAHQDYQWLVSFPEEEAASRIYQKKFLEAIHFARAGLDTSILIQAVNVTAFCAQLMYVCYDSLRNSDSALAYLKLTDSLNNAITSSDIKNQVQEIGFSQLLNEKQQQASQVLARQKEKSRIATGVLLTALVFFLIIVILMWRNNLQRKKTNALLVLQKKEVQHSLAELKSAQAQLIQSEKMASLGELTAGIAHEIQNPLNFVNNFSEVNAELLDEAEKELDAGETEQVRDMLKNIRQNLDKVVWHGKRADAIVKSMLQHSRASTGQREATDLNALVEEYLRLSYHGTRAKDNTFNALLHTSFDPSVGQIRVVAQDIGRVLLNLFNNAFFAMAERKTLEGESYQPELSVETRRTGQGIDILIHDNGPGIPARIMDKIFQPFFTTKPSGQGTGLGLSLSYDIIQAHAGEIRVQTHEGTTFTIHLPLS